MHPRKDMVEIDHHSCEDTHPFQVGELRCARRGKYQHSCEFEVLCIEFEECECSCEAHVERCCQYPLPLDPGESVDDDFLPLRGLSFIRCDTPISWTHSDQFLFNLFKGPSMVSDLFCLLYCCICSINDVSVGEEGCINFGFCGV